MHLADITIDVFSAESAVLRAQAASAANARARGAPRRRRARSSSTTRPCGSTRRRARRSPPTVDGDTLRTMLAALRRLLKVAPDQHGRAADAGLADATVERGGIPVIRRGQMGWMGGMGRIGGMGRVGRISARRGVGPFLRWRQPAWPALRPSLSLLWRQRLHAARLRMNRKTTSARSRPSGRRRTRRSPRGDDPIPTARHAQFLPLGVLPDRSRLRRAGGRSSRSTTRRSTRCRRSTGAQPQDAARRHRWSSRSRGSR